MRWYLRLEPEWRGFAVVVEERIPPHRGVVSYVANRQEARVCLPYLRQELTRRIANADRAPAVYDPDDQP